MRTIRRPMLAIVAGLSLLLLAGCQSSEKTEAATTDHSQGWWEKLTRTPEKITIPPGTRLAVRLDETLSSNGNGSGDTFDATLVEPITLNNRVVVPQGARFSGHVVEARESGHLKTPASLAITLTGMEVDGNDYDISTSTFGRRAKSHKGHDAKWIGGSTAGGALIGALLGGGKGAAIGAGVGAGGGTAAAYATGKKDIVLPAEALVRFELQAPVTVTK
jgi:hypothetical protein